MALTRNFKQTIVARAQRDPRFREALFTEAELHHYADEAVRVFLTAYGVPDPRT